MLKIISGLQKPTAVWWLSRDDNQLSANGVIRDDTTVREEARKAFDDNTD